MNTFTNAINKTVSGTRTTNGMAAYSTTGNKLLDLFSEMGNYQSVMNASLVNAAYSENPLYFTRLLFFNRNVRGGQKVKRMLQYVLQNIDSFVELRNWLKSNLWAVPHFGYWKDLYNLRNTTLWGNVVKFWCNQLIDDYTAMGLGNPKTANITLAAKYAPSERNGANDLNRLAASEFAAYMNINLKQYRKMISAMRKHLNIVERLMSENRWDEIDFNSVPSVAMRNYKNAFKKHVETAYNQWLTSDDTKVNVTALTPVDIVASAPKHSYFRKTYEIDPLLTKQWNSLPGIDTTWNIFPVIDCSGSMESLVSNRVQAIDVAHGLGMYFAHRLKGPYKNLLVEFSRNAKYVHLTGNFENDLRKVRDLSEVSNTNLESVFKLILTTATNNHVDPVDMPTHLIVVSDMQFDSATSNSGYNAIQAMQHEYAKHGYTVPHVIFWNVTRGKAKPVFNNDTGVTLLSGWSGEILNYLLTGEYNGVEQMSLSPVEQMMKIIEHEDYSIIQW